MENGDISAIISKIVSDPEFAGMVNGLRSENGSGELTKEEMLSKIPDVMKTVAPFISQESGKPEEEKPADSANKIVPKYDRVQATKLMQALKPYLSEGRCEIIDKCVSVMQIGDIASALGLGGIGGDGGKK